MAKIETGVDKLVELVSSQKKISLDDAAKALGVSKTVVQEWAEFLEEEGLVGIEYSLSKTYLVEKKLTKRDVQKKEKEYEQKKEAFVRKVDTSLRQLENETAGFEEIKKAYNDLKADIGDEIDQVKEELQELRHYESLKQSIDQDIIQQKIDYQKMVDEVHRKLYAEEKRYEKVLAEIKDETDHLAKEREDLQSIEQKESSLKTRLDALKEVVGGIDRDVSNVMKDIVHDEERLSRLHDIANQIEVGLHKKKKEEIEPLVEASKEHWDKILKVQDSIIQKVQSRSSTISTYEKEGKSVIEKFDAFFKKRMETEKLLKDLDQQKAEMAHELDGLKNKALAFDLLSKQSDVKKYIAELRKDYEEFDRKKSRFQEELEKLKKFISGE